MDYSRCAYSVGGDQCVLIKDHLGAHGFSAADNINPQHYKSGGLEAIDVIEAFKLDFCLGNATKYILRAGKKDPKKFVEDLKKAIWYIEHKIKKSE